MEIDYAVIVYHNFLVPAFDNIRIFMLPLVIRLFFKAEKSEVYRLLRSKEIFKMSSSRGILFVLLLLAVVLYTAPSAYSEWRFKDNGDGSMTDTLTGLEWKKDANACDKVNWEGAKACVNRLGSGWRLPTIEELYRLCNDKGSTEGLVLNANYKVYCRIKKIDIASLLRKDGFTSVQSSYYWSETEDKDNPSLTWVIGMGDSYGTGHGYVNTSDNSNFSHYVWPVRPGR
ncbi:membrane protein containing DUF1566 [Candidatus Magnetobacterium bavaricum]|uniref:Membrane protein containing DUF1566 n=1 Tax=Candidatus Magnetobacterium bavaricum TaxID=29290 RepID=A0A0F3GQL5_9BACT|nr:membrane protein containing DUF1566 [Candidatus Magnetobacterium bavaricum]